MKITSWKLELVWEDGTVNDVSCNVPPYLVDAIEGFSDWWEERYGDDENFEEEEVNGIS